MPKTSSKVYYFFSPTLSFPSFLWLLKTNSSSSVVARSVTSSTSAILSRFSAFFLTLTAAIERYKHEAVLRGASATTFLPPNSIRAQLLVLLAAALRSVWTWLGEHKCGKDVFNQRSTRLLSSVSQLPSLRPTLVTQATVVLLRGQSDALTNKDLFIYLWLLKMKLLLFYHCWCHRFL